MTEHIYTVYKITNTINNKIYIGVHKTTNPNDNYMGSGLNIKRAIKKYNVSNFTKSILFKYNSQKDAYIKESQIVDQSFLNRPDTYNIVLGGQAGKLHNIITDKIKYNMSISQIGRKHSIETKHKMSVSSTGKNSVHFKGYYITPWGEFESSILAENNLITYQSVKNWCKNPNKVISKVSITMSKYLSSLNESPIGKTFKDIGFNFKSIH